MGKFLSNLRSDNQIRERCQLSERIGIVTVIDVAHRFAVGWNGQEIIYIDGK